MVNPSLEPPLIEKHRLRITRILALLPLLLGFLLGAPSHAAPYRYKVTPHFILYNPPALSGKTALWEQRAEAAYETTSEQLGLELRQKIPLYLYARHRDFRQAAGVAPHDMVVGTSETRGGLIRLDASGSFSDAERTLRHEIVHSVLALGLGPRVNDLPLWFNEGLAQVVGERGDPVAEERVRQARGEGTLPRLTQLSAEFPRGEQAGVAYAAASSAAAYYVRLFGWKGVRELLAGVREGRGFSRSFREATGIDVADFYKSWEESLVRRDWWEWIQLFYFPATGMLMIWAMWVAYQRIRHRRRRIEEEDEPEEEEDEEPDIVDPDDEMDYHSGLRSNE